MIVPPCNKNSIEKEFRNLNNLNWIRITRRQAKVLRKVILKTPFKDYRVENTLSQILHKLSERGNDTITNCIYCHKKKVNLTRKLNRNPILLCPICSKKISQVWTRHIRYGYSLRSDYKKIIKKYHLDKVWKIKKNIKNNCRLCGEESSNFVKGICNKCYRNLVSINNYLIKQRKKQEGKQNGRVMELRFFRKNKKGVVK